jgi:hypothetical protein
VPGVKASFKWVLELLDLYKDQNYLYSIKHKTPQLLVLITSMCFPFAAFDWLSNGHEDATIKEA